MVQFVITYITYNKVIMKAYVEYVSGTSKEEARNQFFAKNIDSCSYVLDVKYDC